MRRRLRRALYTWDRPQTHHDPASQSAEVTAKTLMLQGTTSGAGKSTLVTGLCRVLCKRGLRVAPFKPQNMSLNSAVTVDGGEIGRAQAVQAQACGIEPHTDMNPVLIKPNTDAGAQVIVHGHAVCNMGTNTYIERRRELMQAVRDSFRRLSKAYDAIIVEGAGSPAEINLRDRDIANMGFAEAVDCPVVLAADIDRGGVFAHLVGTLALLSRSEQERVEGFIINRFRGELALLQSGLDWLEQRTEKPVLGVMPDLPGLHIEAEDALPRSGPVEDPRQNTFRVAVPALPRISNHTDFDPLRLHPQVNLAFIGPDDAMPNVDLIILPGSKNVISDLQWLRRRDWDKTILRHLRYGGKVIGICGGFQMLGQAIRDPEGVEGPPGHAAGLRVIDMSTTLAPNKQLKNVRGRLSWVGAEVQGYEIHAGVSEGSALRSPAVITDQGADGTVSDDGQILGTYLHGLFDSQQACTELLRWAGLVRPRRTDYRSLREAEIDRLAGALEDHLDIDRIVEILNRSGTRAM